MMKGSRGKSIINSYLIDIWQKVQKLTETWQIENIFTDNWHLYPPPPFPLLYSFSQHCEEIKI